MNQLIGSAALPEFKMRKAPTQQVKVYQLLFMDGQVDQHQSQNQENNVGDPHGYKGTHQASVRELFSSRERNVVDQENNRRYRKSHPDATGAGH